MIFLAIVVTNILRYIIYAIIFFATF